MFNLGVSSKEAVSAGFFGWIDLQLDGACQVIGKAGDPVLY